VEKHSGHARIQPEGTTDHGDHHGDGGDPAHLVHHHSFADANSTPPEPTARRRRAAQQRIAGLAERIPLAQPHHLDHPFCRLWPLGLSHERRRNPGAGEPRDRTSQAEEPGEDRPGHFHLQPAVHLAGFVFRGDDHPRQSQARLLRQPDRRYRHVSGRTGEPEVALSRLRGIGRSADPGRSAEHFHRGREWSSESRG